MGTNNTRTISIELELLYTYLLSRRDPRYFKAICVDSGSGGYGIMVLRCNENRDFVPHNFIGLRW